MGCFRACSKCYLAGSLDGGDKSARDADIKKAKEMAQEDGNA
jgi:putative component of toxin-antitoxin plasmid stabilization module